MNRRGAASPETLAELDRLLAQLEPLDVRAALIRADLGEKPAESEVREAIAEARVNLWESGIKA